MATKDQPLFGGSDIRPTETQDRFVAYLVGEGGGCDYTIGCNTRMAVLPEHITTMQAALDHVSRYDADDDYDASQFGCYHEPAIERIEVLRVIDHVVVLPNAFERAQEAGEAAAMTQDQDARDPEDYARLYRKFEGQRPQ